MIDGSAYYGLYNPAFSEDIGRSMLNQQLGTPGMNLDDYRLGTGLYGYGNPYANGMTQDTVQISGKEPKKKMPVWKKILIGAGVILGGGLLLKFGVKNIKGLRTKMSGFWSKFKRKPKAQPTTPKQRKSLKARLSSFWGKFKGIFKKKPKPQPTTP